MDLLSEASSGGRVLAARHITAEQAVPVANNAINTTLICHSMDLQPDFGTYLAALQIAAPVLWSLGGLLVLVIYVVFGLSLRAEHRRRQSTFKHAIWVLAVYPVAASAAFIAILVPRARIVAEAMGQQAVMIGMYQLFCLLVAECGGVDQLVRRAEGARLETRVLPCCCWPCCPIPRPVLHKSKLSTLRYLVLQLPIMQAILYVVILTVWSEGMNVYIDSFIYIQPFVVASILLGVWAVIMLVKAAESAGAQPRAKFLAVQIALLIIKLQCGLAKVLPEVFTLPCMLPLHPSVFVNLFHNSAMIVEMLLLSLCAYRLYSAPTDKLADKVQHAVVAVMEDGSGTPTARRFDLKEGGIHNKSFRSEVK